MPRVKTQAPKKETGTGRAAKTFTSVKSPECVGITTRTMQNVTTKNGSIVKDNVLNDMFIALSAVFNVEGVYTITKADCERAIDAMKSVTNDSIKTATAVLEASEGDLSFVTVWSPFSSLKVKAIAPREQRNPAILLDKAAAVEALVEAGMSEEEAKAQPEIAAFDAAFEASKTLNTNAGKFRTSFAHIDVTDGVTKFDLSLEKREENAAKAK